LKWRDGTWVVCPYCTAPRTGGEALREHVFERMKDSVGIPSRRHEYRCGTILVESAPMMNDIRNIGYIATVAVCPAALVTLSKALTFVANRYDLMTISSYDTCELVAEKAGNITAKAMYMALRNTYCMQDNFRLPPIPTLASHIRDLAKAKLKE
jgi:hypothetical protein